MIHLSSLSFHYDDALDPALDLHDLHVPAGSCVGIVGAEGSGRTTLFRVLNGTAPRCFPGTLTGTIQVNGHDPQELGHSALGAQVTSIFDDPDSQIISLTVEEEVSFALVQRGMPLNEVRIRSTEALERVGLAGFEGRSTASLSGGQKQRLVMASALALRPRLLLLDESTNALDPEGVQQCFTLVKDLIKREGTTAVFFERDVESLIRYADFIVVLDHGKLICNLNIQDFCQQGLTIRELGLPLPAWLDLSIELSRRGLLQGPMPTSEEECLTRIEPLCREKISA